jgi:hypothetical protein
MDNIVNRSTAFLERRAPAATNGIIVLDDTTVPLLDNNENRVTSKRAISNHNKQECIKV